MNGVQEYTAGIKHRQGSIGGRPKRGRKLRTWPVYRTHRPDRSAFLGNVLAG